MMSPLLSRGLTASRAIRPMTARWDAVRALPRAGRGNAHTTLARAALSGQPIPEDARKRALTPSHDVTFTTPSRRGALPDLQFARRTIKDPVALPQLTADDARLKSV